MPSQVLRKVESCLVRGCDSNRQNPTHKNATIHLHWQSGQGSHLSHLYKLFQRQQKSSDCPHLQVKPGVPSMLSQATLDILKRLNGGDGLWSQDSPLVRRIQTESNAPEQEAQHRPTASSEAPLARRVQPEDAEPLPKRQHRCVICIQCRLSFHSNSFCSILLRPCP